MSLCVTAAGLTVAFALERFTLAWTHSVEHFEWREIWRVAPQGLVIEEAVVQGSGAGIDPPPTARLEPDGWHWRPDLLARSSIIMADAGFGRPWWICSGEICVDTTTIVPHIGSTLVLEACTAPGVPLSVFPADRTRRGER
jgi:hypothetical protein